MQIPSYIKDQGLGIAKSQLGGIIAGAAPGLNFGDIGNMLPGLLPSGMGNSLASYLAGGVAKSDKQLAWGDITFSQSEGNPLESMSRSYDGGWIEIDLLNELPLPQQTGRKLDSMTLGGRWYHRAGISGENVLARARDERKARTLVRGDGTNLGRWYLKNFEVRGSSMIHDGSCVVTDITITLSEFPTRERVGI